jgi:endonuclease/exonuclease/phosphatase family metal-dependent hydrolase
MKMKNKIALTLFGALAIASSCNKMEERTPELVEITVSSEATSKTELDGSSVVWTQGDRMVVFSSGITTGKIFRLGGDPGTSSGTFYGEVPEDAANYFACYPSTVTYDGASTFHYTMPAEVPYTRGTFAPDSNPMLSGTKSTFDGNFSMKNLCGVLRLKLKGNIEISSLELAFDSYVSGPGHVYRGGNTLTMDGSTDAHKKVTMVFDSPVQLEPNAFSEFYFVLPAAEYDGMTIKATLPNSNYSTKNVSSIFTITRSAVTTMEGEMPAPALANRPELQIWSFNIACQKNDDNSGWDSSHYWSARKSGIYSFFNTQEPDIIGTQECEYRQRVNILDNTSGYAAYGLGGEYGKESSGSTGYLWNKKDYNTDSSCAIFYKTSKFDVLDYGTFWLSANPASAGSDDGHCCSWIKFRWKENGYEFYFFNTHFTAHYTDEAYAARLAEASILYDQIEAINSEHLPVIITGDFNESASDLYNPEKGDSRWSNYYFARNQDGKTSKTSYPTSYNGFDTTCSNFSTIYSSGTCSGNRSNLDHIIYRYCYDNSKHGLKAGTFGTDFQAYAGTTYISDHWPITATLVFDFQ